MLANLRWQHVEAFLALRSANDLADSRREDIDRTHRTAIVITRM